MDGYKRVGLKDKNWYTYGLLKETEPLLIVDECAKRCDEDSTCSAFEVGNGKVLSKMGDCDLKRVSEDKFTAKSGVDLYINKIYVYEW
jgi:hypothetical protein